MERQIKLIDRTELLVIQATSFCNIDCSYCYLPNRSKSNHFDLRILSSVFENLHQSNLLHGEITILWHCGEPLVLPIDFYKQATAIIQRCSEFYKINIHQSFQTNGMLISQEFCDLIKEIGATIGVSIDGPQFIHDKFRKKRNGTGTFDETYQGIMLLKRNNINFSAIAVVTDNTLDHPSAFYEFFKTLSPTRLGINLDETSGINSSSSFLRGEEKKERFLSFFKSLWILSYEKGDGLLIREFEDMLYRLNLDSTVSFINTLTTPFQHITVDHKGNFSTFCPELMASPNKEFIFGNIDEVLVSEIHLNANFNKVKNEIEKGVKQCKQTCDYFELCYGGTPSNKFFENGSFDSTETIDCLYTKKYMADLVIGMLEQQSDLQRYIN